MNSQLSYQDENIHLFQRMNRCNNVGFQGLKGSVGSTFFTILNQSHKERSG